MERREHPRVEVKVPLYIGVASGEIYQKMVPITSRNISSGGLLFETHRAVPLEAESRVMVSRLGDLPDGAQIEGRVVYCHQDPASGLYQVGIQFTAFISVTREQLVARIESWRAASDMSPR